MEHFADFGVIKQQNKLKKKYNEVAPNSFTTTNKNRTVNATGLSSKLEGQMAGEPIIGKEDWLRNIDTTKQLPNKFGEVDSVNNYIKGKKQISRDAVKAKSVDPLTMPYEKKLDWTAKQSFGDVLKAGLKTKPVRKSSEESLVSRASRAARDKERYDKLIYPRNNKEKFQQEVLQPARQASRLLGNFM